MSKASKIWLIVAAALVLCGGMVFSCSLGMVNWDFNNLASDNYETKIYEFDEELDDIYISANTANIELIAWEENATKLVCYEKSEEPHNVSLSDGALKIEYIDERALIDYIGISSDAPKITLYLPLGTWGNYGNLSIKTSTGDISLPTGLGFDSVDIKSSTGDVRSAADVFGAMKIEADTGDADIKGVFASSMEISIDSGHISLEDVECEGEVQLSVDTGDIKLKNVICESLVSKGDTGDILMEALTAYASISIECDTGDIKFRSCESPLVRMNADTGDIIGSFAGDMVITAESNTGDVNVPLCANGGRGYINTNTGDIKIEIAD